MYNCCVGDIMEFNLLRLKNNLDTFIPVNLVYSFDRKDLEGTDIIRLDNISITGRIYKNSLDEISLDINIKGSAILKCAITLNEVEYPLNISISNTVDELLNENNEIVKKDENTLDILPIIWENILMEIPIRVVSEGAEAQISNLKGNGWRVITEEDNSDINPELAKLKDLL